MRLCGWVAFGVNWSWAALGASWGWSALPTSPGMPGAGGFAGLKRGSATSFHFISLAISRALAIRSIVILDSVEFASVRCAVLPLESLSADTESGLCLDCEWLPFSLCMWVLGILSSRRVLWVLPRGSSSERCSCGGGEGFLALLTRSGLGLLAGCQNSSGVRAGEGRCVPGLLAAFVCGALPLPAAAISDKALRRAACDIRSTSLSLILRLLNDSSKTKTVLVFFPFSFRVG